MQTKITTERLSLDILLIDDFAFIRELVNTEGWLKFIGDRNIHSDEDAIKYIKKINDNTNFTYWVVRIKDTNVPIGIITLLKRDYLEYADIGFAFLPEYNGQGYAYEAAKEVLPAVSKKPDHKNVLAILSPENNRSITLLTKLGFHFEKEIEVAGELLHVYSNDVNA
jgi:[ribosomal protein S5]-alanine N-acetyltransferase